MLCIFCANASFAGDHKGHRPFIRKTEDTFQVLKGKVHCSAKKPIVFNSKAWTVDLCDGSQKVKFKLKGKFDDSVDVRGDDALPPRDLDGDGKTDFLVFYGQCVEGPCLGDYMLLNVENDKVRQRYVVEGPLLSYLVERGKSVLLMKRICWTHEFAAAFGYLAVAEFDPKGELKVIPYRDVTKRFPAQIAELKAHATASINMLKAVIAHAKIKSLIIDSYDGRDSKAIASDLGAAMKYLTIDELAVHCNPSEILSELTRSNN